MKRMKRNFGQWWTSNIYLFTEVPVPVQHMASFYHSVAEHSRDVLKLPIRGCVQAVSASRRQWRKWIGAAEWERAKVQDGILYNKWYLLDTICLKCSGKSPFLKYIGFQSDALEFLMCQMRGQTYKMMHEKAGAEGQNSKKGFEKNEHVCIV